MHSADHQHMGKTRRPVGTAKVFGQMSAVTQHHGRQHPRRALCHPLRRAALSRLWSRAVLARKLSLGPRCFIPERYSPAQGNAVRIGRKLLCPGWYFQRKAGLHPLPRPCTLAYRHTPSGIRSSHRLSVPPAAPHGRRPGNRRPTPLPPRRSGSLPDQRKRCGHGPAFAGYEP